MIILGGSASSDLAEKVAKEVGENVGRLEIKRFPDGDKYVRILDDVKGQDVAVIQSLYHKPHQHIYADLHIFELLMIVDTLRDLGAKTITVVAPYLAYARQDSRFYPGEALSSQVIARLLEDVGTTKFLTVDCHLHRLGDVAKIFKIPAQNLSAMPLLGKYGSQKNLCLVHTPRDSGRSTHAGQERRHPESNWNRHNTKHRKSGLSGPGDRCSTQELGPTLSILIN